MNETLFNKVSIFFVFFLFSLFVNSQQSKAYRIPPEGASLGEIGVTKQSQVLLSGVPIYLWYRGCGPTALGMVVGYYDNLGFPDLVIGDAFTQTPQVNEMIASEEHYDEYSLPKDYYPTLKEDKSELGGAHISNSIADYMFTSWSSKINYWGWSWSNDVGAAFAHYALQQNENYVIETNSVYYNSDSWNYLKTEIDNNRPVVLLVDSSGDGSTDHFVTGIGYDDSTHQYAIYNTWDSSVHWHEYRAMSSSYSWGVFNFITFLVENHLSIDELESNISIYPNPSDGLFKIDMDAIDITNVRIEIYDSKGSFLFDTNKTTIDLGKYSSGMYWVKIYQNFQVNSVIISKR